MACGLISLVGHHFVNKRSTFNGHKDTETFPCDCEPSTLALIETA